jgi:hypothetical protein
MNVIAGFQGFIYFREGLGADFYFNDNSRVVETVENVFLAFALVIGDAMIASAVISMGSTVCLLFAR